MSWSGTYTHNVAIALDELAAAVFFNRNDVTVSSLCRIVQLADSGVHGWPERLRSLGFAPWQVAVLRWLARRLDALQPFHCELARVSDIERSGTARALLTMPPGAAT